MDANKDGTQEFFIEVSTRPKRRSVVGVFGLDDDELFRFTDQDGSPFRIVVGGGRDSGSGAECVHASGHATELVLMRIENAASRRSDFRSWVYEWRGRRLILVDTSKSLDHLTDRASKRRRYFLSCFGLLVRGPSS